MKKKLFKHGGSYAVDLPISFVRDMATKTVMIEKERDRIVIAPNRSLDTIEQEPAFKTFVDALLQDAMKRPGKLRAVKEVWDEEWDELLKDAAADGE